ncbi:5-methylthioadenosine/S-adenosylhomocysteine deaminase [Caloramator fervidus]|uniref:5-methylthioadenosine/S-adenosylhomocysteine deaminase n=1 Tax=Caloramator fervidus TaxID=29344 RepID=A0A1H5SXG0_9CLOT|nr:amidohydrolase [Caloramator fervidus]SEF54467.1 5-methylthioadenosine/S-adenosylhomocysteine deaminase [Caloramator fervidus]
MDKLLIENVGIITMEENNFIDEGYIYIEDGIIKEVKSGSFKGEKENLKKINGIGCIALPGFINCHTHVPMTLLRGYGEGLPLMRWLKEKIWPFEAKLEEEDIYNGALLGIIEMIKSGTTSFVDMYFKEDVIAKACKEANIRGFLGNPIIGDGWQGQVEDTISLFEKFKHDEMVKIFIAPHSPYTCSFECLKEVGEVARKLNIPIHIHIAETKDEVYITKDKYSLSPAFVCYETGLFDKNKTLAAHCVYLNDADMEMLLNYDFTAVYNPQSNMKLASGVAPVVKMIRKGINVALGTDGASSNNNLNMIEEMQTASLLQKLNCSDATALNAFETLQLATVNAAKAIGMENNLGYIKEGFYADIILIDFNKAHLNPKTDVYSNIVFSAQGSDVKTVIINGKVVMENYEIKVLDEEKVIFKANKSFKDVLSRL